jgi:hypothetical protein
VEKPDWHDQIVAAFGGLSEKKAQEIAASYRHWLRLQEESLGPLTAAVLPGLVQDKVAALRRADASRRELIFRDDTLRCRLDPLDQRAAAWAQRVLRGGRLLDQERGAAEQALDQVQGILREAAATISDKRTLDSLRFLGSEVLQDFRFALNNGEGPMSLRLGRFADSIAEPDSK